MGLSADEIVSIIWLGVWMLILFVLTVLLAVFSKSHQAYKALIWKLQFDADRSTSLQKMLSSNDNWKERRIDDEKTMKSLYDYFKKTTLLQWRKTSTSNAPVN